METAEGFLPGPGCVKPDPDGFYPAHYPAGDYHGFKGQKGFAEPNNNEGVKTEESGGFGDGVFWGQEDLNAWGDWTEQKTDPQNTDGAVYTLTVLNSNDWCRGQDRGKRQDNLDIDSFLSIIPEGENSDSSGYYYPEFPGETFGEKEGPPTNNNDWKMNNMNDSLLRSALQGKRSYCKKAYGEGSAPVTYADDTSPLDEILGLSTIETFDDYEKIKKIANEVADCAKYSLGEVPSTFLDPLEDAKAKKKAQRKPAGCAPVKPTAGHRKERSLHYCSICSKGFKDKYSVNVHVRTHTGEKPFTCTLCGKSFRQKAHLAKHYQTHLTQTQKHIGAGGSSHGKPRSSKLGDGGR